MRSLLVLLCLTSCINSQKAETIGDAGAVAQRDGGLSRDRDMALDLVRDRTYYIDLRAAYDSATDDGRLSDVVIFADSGVVDSNAFVDAVLRVDSSTYDTRGPDSALVFPDAVASDSAAGAPTMRIEIYQAAQSEDLSVTWRSPVGDTCSNSYSAEICDWDNNGTISISGDEDGAASPNWAELSGVRVANGFFRARAGGVCVGQEICAVSETKIFVDDQLIRTIGELVDLEFNQTFCMPIVDGQWNVQSFWWQDALFCE